MRQRGSAYIYVLLMILAITTVGLSIADATIRSILDQKRIIDKATADQVLDGAADQIEVLRVFERIPIPSARSITVGTTPVTVNITAGPSIGTMAVNLSTTVAGKTYSRNLVTGLSRPTPFYYAMAANATMSLSKVIVVGSASLPGSIWSASNINLTKPGITINGDAVQKGSNSNSGVVNGQIYTNVTEDIFTTTGLLDYLTLASTKFLLNQDWNGYTFPSVAANQPYNLVHITGNLKIKGVISGRGTIYVTGNVDVSGNMSYASPDSKLVIIAEGGINLDQTCVGYFYSKGTLRFKTNTQLTGGAYGVSGFAQDDDKSVITFDPFLALNPEEGTRFRLPGY